MGLAGSRQDLGAVPSFLSQVPGSTNGHLQPGLQYETRPDIRGVWAADPSIATLASISVWASSPLQAVSALALIAHSMGGLVVQGFVGMLASRAQQSVFCSVPSAGLTKAGPLSFLKRQDADMGAESDFS